MKDNDLIRLIRGRIAQGIAQMGPEFAEMPVIQKNQPTQQGVPYDKAVYFELLFERPRGWAKTTSTPQTEEALKFDVKEFQLVATYFQISALAIQDPSDVNSTTASDIVSQLRMWMNHRMTVEYLSKNKVNVELVREIKNNPFEDDRHRSEYHPGFELVVTNYQESTVVVDGAIPDPDGKVLVISKTGPQPGSESADVVMI